MSERGEGAGEPEHEVAGDITFPAREARGQQSDPHVRVLLPPDAMLPPPPLICPQSRNVHALGAHQHWIGWMGNVVRAAEHLDLIVPSREMGFLRRRENE